MKISIPIVISLSIICSCNNTSDKHEKRNINGNRDSIQLSVKFNSNISEDPVNLLYLDELNDNKTIEFNKTDTFPVTANFVSTTPIFFLDWSLNQNYYLLYPREKVVIRPSNDSLQFLRLNSSMPNRSDELSFFEKLGNHDISFYFNHSSYNIYSKARPNKGDLLMSRLKNKKLQNPANAIAKTDSFYKSRKEFLLDYKKNYKISDTFFQIIEKYIKYDYLADILETLNNADSSLYNRKDLSDSAFSIKDFNCDSCLFIPTYKSALIAYSNFLMKQNNILNFSDSFNLISEFFKNNSREFLLFSILKKQINKQSKVDNTLYLTFKKINSNKTYEIYLEENISYLNNVEQSEISASTIVRDKAGNEYSFQDILEKQKNKVVLIDFWASWCKPCIYELPFSNKLNKKFSKNDVVFIYLSMDKNISDWKASGKDIQSEEENYILLNTFDSPLAKKMKITGIPRYIVIDKQSAIISSDAPRPSDISLYDLIYKLVRK
ncbi:MAG: TlpA disulfide reductase family protein [Chitinophagaceae bacterium]